MEKSLIGTNLESEFQCSVCTDILQEPKVLPCGHSFCLKPCLEKLARSSGANSFLCPNCRTVVVCPKGGVAFLPDNYILKGVLKELTKTVSPKNCLRHCKPLWYFCVKCQRPVCEGCTIQEHRHESGKEVVLWEVLLNDKKEKFQKIAENIGHRVIEQTAAIEDNAAINYFTEEANIQKQMISEKVDDLFREIEKQKRLLFDLIDQEVIDKVTIYQEENGFTLQKLRSAEEMALSAIETIQRNQLPESWMENILDEAIQDLDQSFAMQNAELSLDGTVMIKDIDLNFAVYCKRVEDKTDDSPSHDTDNAALSEEQNTTSAEEHSQSGSSHDLSDAIENEKTEDTVVIYGLGKKTHKSDVFEHFSTIGQVETDKATGNSLVEVKGGVGIVTYKNPQMAEWAVECYDGCIMDDGRRVDVRRGKKKLGANGEEKQPIKDKIQTKQKGDESGEDHEAAAAKRKSANVEKRRLCRVQGSGPICDKNRGRASMVSPVGQVRGQCPVLGADSAKRLTGVTVSPQTVDQSTEVTVQTGFVYDDSQQVRPNENDSLKESEISAKGYYNISETPNGKSRITYDPNFLGGDEALNFYNFFKRQLNWQQKINSRANGVTYLEPRLTIWFGEQPYTNSKATWNLNKEWDEQILALKDKVEQYTQTTFNSVLCNYYRNGKDCITWHSDDEYCVDRYPQIASVSLGDTRWFQMMTKRSTIECATARLPFGKKLKFPLTNGSLVIMEKATQLDWLHQVPREYHDRDGVIHLTFRKILTENRATNS